MTTPRITSQNGGTVPIACNLTPADLAAQSGRWERLANRALDERVETAHGLRLSFRRAAGAEDELRRLVAVENQCCRWATWTVETRAGHVVLDISSTGAGIAALRAMFTRLHPAGPRC